MERRLEEGRAKEGRGGERKMRRKKKRALKCWRNGTNDVKI